MRHVSLPVFAPIGVGTVPNVSLGASAHAMRTSPLKDRRGSRGVGLDGDRNLDARLGRFPCGCFRMCCRKVAAQVALVEAVYILRNSAKPIRVCHISFLGHKLRCSVD